MATLLFICKRRPQGRDLLSRPYGRYYHLPMLLARAGHSVHVVVLGAAAASVGRDDVHWHAPGLFDPRMPGRLSNLARRLRPDWIVGGSDAWVGCIAHRLARHVGARLALDAYDNFESYMPWNLPLHRLWRRAIAAADLTTAAGPQLAGRLDRERATASATQILPMAADPGFVPLDREDCRNALRLPPAAPLLGYGGSWSGRGVTASLPAAFAHLRARIPAAQLVLSGRPPPAVARQPGVISLGYLTDAEMPLFLNAIDVAAVITAADDFGHYSYPAKLCEAIACGTRVVATATAPVCWMLEDRPQALVPVGDVMALADALSRELSSAPPAYAPRQDWGDVAITYSRMLSS